MRFDAILFDCDGVLVDSEILGLEDCAAYLRGHGLSYDGADLVRRFTGLRDDVFARRLEDAYRAANASDPPADFFERLIEVRRRRRDDLAPVKGAAEMLRAVACKAVASSSRAAYLESKLKRTGLWDLVAPHVYSGDAVAHGKPAPDIYLHAAQKLRVDPARCLVVEDSEIGVAAGIAAGMTVAGFVGGGHCFEGHAERLAAAGAGEVFADFAALLRAIGN